MARESADTRDRLLESAGKVFSERGFRDATVAEISRKARANIAAVNYHFGSKEALYREAWQHAHRAMLHAFPPDGGVSPDSPAEQRLKGRIRSMLQRALSDEGLEFRIMNHEIANPTGLLGQVIRDTVRPLREAMESIVSELLGGRAEDMAVRLCVTSIIGPCMQVMWRRHMDVRQGLESWCKADTLETMVDHFAAFALAGIRETRGRIESSAPRGHLRGQQRGSL